MKHTNSLSDGHHNCNGLWTKNFTIITVGSAISMLGNAVSYLAIAVLIIDMFDSGLLFALFMVAYNMPKPIVPMIAGAYLDKFSRKRMIYTLDFISSSLYLLIFFLLTFNLCYYWIFIVLALIIGSIDSIYTVAYDSLYPNLVSEGNLQKAYSISSMLYPLSTIMVPVSLICYITVGLAPLFIFNAVTFFIAAVFETRIDYKEEYADTSKHHHTKMHLADFKEGFRYITSDKGLFRITLFFVIYSLTLGTASTLVMPYFTGTSGTPPVLPTLFSGEYSGLIWYMLVTGCVFIGRFLGGGFQYFLRLSHKIRYRVAVIIAVVTTVIEATYLLFNVYAMMPICIFNGMIYTILFNLRTSSTQNYVCDEKRARFNGTFQTLTNLGNVFGMLVASGLSTFMYVPYAAFIAMSVNMIAVFAVFVGGQKYIRPIFNKKL